VYFSTESLVKRFLTISVLLQAVTGLMTLVLVTIFAGYAARALESREQARRVPVIIDISNDLFAATQTFRIERGDVNTGLQTSAVLDSDTQKAIAELRAASAETFDSVLARLEAVIVPDAGPVIDEIDASRNALVERREVDGSAASQGSTPEDLRRSGLPPPAMSFALSTICPMRWRPSSAKTMRSLPI
jgi:hypothetical protein